MKPILFFISVIFFSSQCSAQNEVPSAGIQIKSALLAAPPEKKDSCTVYGYSADKQFILLRKGTNELICLADDPNQPGFSVACYHKDLEPFMQRGRELRKQGMKDQEIFDTREKEVKAGTLQMPKQPATMYVFSADDKDFDRVTGEVKNGYLRSVIYIAYATSASTGLPEKPSGKGMPWIMNPGTHRAHIMINP
ncbi:MAG TPA: hypothetical protein PLA68_14620 [Panacibacter sp.]|nr:hypothetical protein [Panacibacter sp.]